LYNAQNTEIGQKGVFCKGVKFVSRQAVSYYDSILVRVCSFYRFQIHSTSTHLLKKIVHSADQ
ncbi:MAG: hypothetical protein WBG61_10435, partial [Desulfobacterales bacterium]